MCEAIDNAFFTRNQVNHKKFARFCAIYKTYLNKTKPYMCWHLQRICTKPSFLYKHLTIACFDTHSYNHALITYR